MSPFFRTLSLELNNQFRIMDASLNLEGGIHFVLARILLLSTLCFDPCAVRYPGPVQLPAGPMFVPYRESLSLSLLMVYRAIFLADIYPRTLTCTHNCTSWKSPQYRTSGIGGTYHLEQSRIFVCVSGKGKRRKGAERIQIFIKACSVFFLAQKPGPHFFAFVCFCPAVVGNSGILGKTGVSA